MAMYKRLATLVLAMAVLLGGLPSQAAGNWRSLVLKGTIKAQAKDWPQAQRYFQDALTNAPQDAASRASIFNSLAGVYVELAQYDKALNAYQEALSLYSTALGSNSQVLATVQTNQAQCYLKQGNHTEAQRVLKSAMAILNSQQPPAVFEKYVAMDVLAGSYEAKNQLAELKALNLEQYKVTQTLLGVLPPLASALAYPPDTSEKKQQLALVAEAMRHLHKQAMASKALSVPQMNQLVHDIVDMSLRQEKFEQAEPAYQLMLSELKRDLGDNNPDVAKVLFRLGLTKQGQKAYSEAITFYERAYLIEDRLPQRNSAFLLELLTQLAQAQEKSNLTGETDKTYQMALPLADKAKPSFTTARLYKEAAAFYQRTKQAAKAKPFQTKAQTQGSLIKI